LTRGDELSFLNLSFRSPRCGEGLLSLLSLLRLLPLCGDLSLRFGDGDLFGDLSLLGDLSLFGDLDFFW